MPPQLKLDDLQQLDQEGDSPMDDPSPATYSPPDTRRAVSAGGSSSTSAGDVQILPPPPSAAAAAAAAAGEDCGECAHCLDKPKFGGPGIKRKGCLARREGKVIRPSSLTVAVCGTPPVAQAPATFSPVRESLSPGGSTETATDGRSSAMEVDPSVPPPPVALPSSDPSEDCGTCVNCLDKPRFGGPGIKRKGCLRKREAVRGVAHPAHSIAAAPAAPAAPAAAAPPGKAEAEAPASCKTEEPRNASVQTPVTVDALAEPSPYASGPLARLRAEARGSRKRVASGLAAGSSSADAGSSSRSSDADDDMADDAPAGEASAAGSTPGAADPAEYASVRLIGEGLDESSPRPPLNELSVNRNGRGAESVPSTPLLKTPELEVAAGGVSPLSEFANILEVTPNLRLPEQGGTPANDVSPLFQLANLLEKTPRLPTQLAQSSSHAEYGKHSPPSDPEELKDARRIVTVAAWMAPQRGACGYWEHARGTAQRDGALLAGGLDSPRVPATVWDDTPGQLHRDLNHALRAAQYLASPHQPMGPPPPPGDANGNSKARKRKLEQEMDTKGKDGPAGKRHAYSGEEGVEGMFDTLGVDMDGDSIKVDVGKLLDADLLSASKRRSQGGGRSKNKEKEAGKPKRCRCDRSGCLKRYCVCFAAGNLCAPDCKCKGCENDDSTEERRKKRLMAVEEMLKKKSSAFTPRISGEALDKVHQVGCNCKKSGCRKRYCECYQAGVRCHEKCKCFDCENPAGVNPLSRSKPDVSQPNMQDDAGGGGAAPSLLQRRPTDSSDYEMMSQDSVRSTGSPSGSPSKTAALMAAAAAAAAVDHPTTMNDSPCLGAAPAPAFTPDVAMEATQYRQERMQATTGESSRPSVATGESLLVPPSTDDSDESYARRQRLGTDSDATPDCVPLSANQAQSMGERIMYGDIESPQINAGEITSQAQAKTPLPEGIVS